MDKKSDFHPGTLVFLENFPHGTASFAVSIKEKIWRQGMVGRHEGDKLIKLFDESKIKSVPLFILGDRIEKFSQNLDIFYLYPNPHQPLRYTFGTVNEKMKRVSFEEVNFFIEACRKLGFSGSLYLDSLESDVVFLQRYLAGDHKKWAKVHFPDRAFHLFKFFDQAI